MYLKAVFNNMVFKNVIEIPRNSVHNFDEVFIVLDGRLALRKVNLIKTNENTYFVNGLDEGDKLVVEPLVNVSENTTVKIFNK